MEECIYTVKFDLIQDIKFYMCRKYRTHIALVRENDTAHRENSSINMEYAVNLLKITPEHYVASGRTKIAYMCCMDCKTPLGWKYVEVEFSTNLIRKERVILYMDRLLFWNGKKIERYVGNKGRNH